MTKTGDERYSFRIAFILRSMITSRQAATRWRRIGKREMGMGTEVSECVACHSGSSLGSGLAYSVVAQ